MHLSFKRLVRAQLFLNERTMTGNIHMSNVGFLVLLMGKITSIQAQAKKKKKKTHVGD